MRGGERAGRRAAVTAVLLAVGVITGCGGEMPYGEAPPTPTPAPSEITASRAHAVQDVLVASVTIAVGESMLSALQAGKFSLEPVSVSSVLSRAVTTTEDLRGVALAEVPAGAQITEDTFGVPSAVDLQEMGVTEELYKAARQAAVRSDYDTAAPSRPTSDMRILAYRFAHRCQAVADGSTTWRRAASDDVSDDSPSYDEAVELHEYLEITWCPAVLG